MKYKQLILRKIFELNNFFNAHNALVSTSRSQEELLNHVERLKAKLLEIETLINSESEQQYQ